MIIHRLFNKRTAVVLMSMVLLSACGGDKADTAQNTEVAKVETPMTVLRVATEGAFPPYNYTNEDGSLGGFDVDIANAICDKMQVKCEISAQDWDGIIPALKTGKYDAIIDALSITPERQEQVDFSEPYYSNPLVFVAKKDSNFDPTNPDDINSNTILAQRGTIAVTWMEENHPNAKLLLQDTLTNSFLDLAAGRAAATVVDRSAANTWIKTEVGKDFTIKGPEISFNDSVAIAINKGNPQLLSKINNALAEMKADGTYDEIVTKNNF